jgi:L-alanine-DL-glutamate epimerase-like enolase superfamily enzyme
MRAFEFGTSPANQGLAEDVVVEPIKVIDGHFTVPTGPGLGVEVDESKL